MTASAPPACRAAIAGAKSRISPDVPGYCRSAPNTVFGVDLAQRIADQDLPAERFGARTDDGDGLRVAIGDRQKSLFFDRANALRHRHRLSRGGCLVEKRCISDGEPGQISDHGLEIQQRFQTALADLRLIRRIGRVPRRIFQDIALDDRRQNSPVVALANQRVASLVFARDRDAAWQLPPLRKVRGRNRAARADAYRGIVCSISSSRLDAPTTSSIAATIVRRHPDVTAANYSAGSTASAHASTCYWSSWPSLPGHLLRSQR